MPDADTIEGRIQRVKDGDTFVVATPSGTVTVRLWAVDAPETGQAYGPAATRGARKVAEGERCRVVVKSRDRYGRLVGRIVILEDGKEHLDVGRSLVFSGGAWARGEYASGIDHLHNAQQDARQAGRGLWAQADPTPPWDYRSTEKEPTVWDAAQEGFRWGRWIWRLLRKL